jgi:hypothetical protein
MHDYERARRVLATSRVPHPCLYLVGTFDTGVTVLSQQVRALNLVWALIEAEQIRVRPPGVNTLDGPRSNIAIVGAGFAGLAVAAGLIKKGAHANITIFEQRDTLLPLQHGSDARWLHPRIYNWPDEGSETNAAMLPVLNWTAARASDVVVQVLLEWKELIEPVADRLILYCNTRHLQIYEPPSGGSRLQIEWIGDQRNPCDGTTNMGTSQGPVGKTASFDLVILAVGFGMERDAALSYWRNDTLGQPSLEKPRLTFLLSGQGDGAMIDLFRLRISQYRQDRILRDLFEDTPLLVAAVESLYQEHHVGRKSGMFAALEKLPVQCSGDFNNVRAKLSKRLRRDTDVILHLKVRKLAELLESPHIRISFQNKLLVYLLYKCGGFTPSTESEDELKRQHSIPDDQVIHRHGPDRDKQLKGLLWTTLFQSIHTHHRTATPSPFVQSDRQAWRGGYFGFTGRMSDAEQPDLDLSVTLEWRKEYLPVATALVGTAFCSAIAGMLRKYHMRDKRLRVTLHRAVTFGDDELLQQCCEYFGINPSPPDTLTAARTFPAHNATIGLAYDTRRIVRSLRGVDPGVLRDAMRKLELSRASSKMSPDVHFLLAIPLLEPEREFTSPTPVSGVLFVDSMDPNFYVDGDLLEELVSAIDSFLLGLEDKPAHVAGGIFNMKLARLCNEAPRVRKIPPEVINALELVTSVDPPQASRAFQFNFAYSDFIPVKSGWTAEDR